MPFGVWSIGRDYLSFRQRIYLKISGILWTYPQQYGFGVWQRLCDWAFKCIVSDCHAFKPIQRGNYYLEQQWISVCRVGWCLQHWKQHYASEKESRYCGAGERKNWACLWGTSIYAHYNERDTSGLW